MRVGISWVGFSLLHPHNANTDTSPAKKSWETPMMEALSGLFRQDADIDVAIGQEVVESVG